MSDRPRVVLHVGLPKTGTSFLQSVLRENAPRLRAHGLQLPAVDRERLFSAVLYLTDRSADWGRSAEEGRAAWDEVLAQLRRSSGTTVVSSETLALADEQQVARILGDLGAVDVELVVTTRDPARQLPAEWQEGLKHGRYVSYPRFLDAVLGDPAALRGDQRARWRRYWWRQDPVAVLDRWARSLPTDRVHVVTGPRPGAPKEKLWARFAAVLGVPADEVTLPAEAVNTSLGAVQLELLRRVNARVPRTGRRAYGTVVKRMYAGTILRAQGGERLVLPPERQDAAREVAARWVAEIRERRWHVVGDLDELLPAVQPAESPPAVTPVRVLDAAVDATAALLGEVQELVEENARLRSELGEGAGVRKGHRVWQGPGRRWAARLRRVLPFS